MKLKTDLIIRNIAGECVAVPTGKAASQINGLLSLTPSGELLIRRLQEECTQQELVQALLDQYEVTEQMAQADVEAFLAKLRDVNLL